MSAIDRRGVIAGLGAGLVTGCTTLEQVADGPKPPAEGGIGGTGIIGTLTDFGSLMVNGLRVVTNGATEVTDTFGQIGIDAVRIGQSLTIEAEQLGGSLLARRVHVAHPVLGTVTVIAPDGALSVDGVTVVREADARGTAEVGMRVAVSGLWRGQQVVASRIDPVDAAKPSVLAGTVERDGMFASPTIGGVPLEPAAGLLLPGTGKFGTLRGRFADGRLLVEHVVPERFEGAAGPLIDLSVEGYLDEVAAAPGYRIAGLGHSFDRGAKLARFEAERTLFSGPYTGTFDVATGLPLPERFEERRDLLRQGSVALRSKMLPAR
ncbi:MAG: DUF5666 domain-containing protein [Pseudomonadota bacterium]